MNVLENIYLFTMKDHVIANSSSRLLCKQNQAESLETTGGEKKEENPFKLTSRAVNTSVTIKTLTHPRWKALPMPITIARTRLCKDTIEKRSPFKSQI